MEANTCATCGGYGYILIPFGATIVDWEKCPDCDACPPAEEVNRRIDALNNREA